MLLDVADVLHVTLCVETNHVWQGAEVVRKQGQPESSQNQEGENLGKPISGASPN